jgi:hypothetical protein
MHESAAEQRNRLSGPARPVCLEQCVQAFLQPEQLSHEDEWYCPKCKEFVQVWNGGQDIFLLLRPVKFGLLLTIHLLEVEGWSVGQV